MNIVTKILNLYLQLIMFGINNVISGISGLWSGNISVSFVKGAFALALASAIPSIIFGALGFVLSFMFSAVLPIILSIVLSVMLTVILSFGWKILSDRRNGKGFKTSFNECTEYTRNFLRYSQWKLPTLGKLTGNNCWGSKKCWTEGAGNGISTSIGTQDDDKEATFTLDDKVPHVLLAGKSGSGKSNLLHVIIHGLAHRYSPDELEFYLMDYKDGVEFTAYGGDKFSNTQGLPHVRLVATAGDAEYGITVLEFLQKELLRRNNLFTSSGVKDFKGYRQRGTLPRLLVIIDEFQVLFLRDDATTARVNALLSDLLSRGRSAGINILLATQSLSALLGVLGFNAVRTKLNCRIALACSKEESEFILEASNHAAANFNVKNTQSRYGILNNDDGQRSSNIKFLIPFAAPDDCANHQAQLAEQVFAKPKEVKIFSGAKLPQLPTWQWFKKTQKNTLQVILGEELCFESAVFSFEWDQSTGNNLLIVGHDDVIHKGLLYSLAFSATNHFTRIVYFNTNRHFTTVGFSGPHISVKRFDWDGNIANVVADMKKEKTLLIVDTLENAKVFSPPSPYGTPSTPPSPAELFKHFLEEAPPYGSHVVAFAANWKRFESQCRDYLGQFDLRIGFNLDEMSAGSLINTPTGMFKGLDNSTKAVFSNLQSNELVLFRPFV